MEDKKPKLDIKLDVVVTDTETGEVIAPKGKPVSPFFKVSWGWICLGFIALFVLSVKGQDFLPFHHQIGGAAVWGVLISFFFFIAKLVDKLDREGGSVGSDYPYLGM